MMNKTKQISLRLSKETLDIIRNHLIEYTQYLGSEGYDEDYEEVHDIIDQYFPPLLKK